MLFRSNRRPPTNLTAAIFNRLRKNEEVLNLFFFILFLFNFYCFFIWSCYISPLHLLVSSSGCSPSNVPIILRPFSEIIPVRLAGTQFTVTAIVPIFMGYIIFNRLTEFLFLVNSLKFLLMPIINFINYLLH